jgi:hypothetical protein
MSSCAAAVTGMLEKQDGNGPEPKEVQLPSLKLVTVAALADCHATAPIVSANTALIFRNNGMSIESLMSSPVCAVGGSPNQSATPASGVCLLRFLTTPWCRFPSRSVQGEAG